MKNPILLGIFIFIVASYKALGSNNPFDLLAEFASEEIASEEGASSESEERLPKEDAHTICYFSFEALPVTEEEEEVLEEMKNKLGKASRERYSVEGSESPCIYMLRDRTCSFGASCQFNHEPKVLARVKPCLYAVYYEQCTRSRCYFDHEPNKIEEYQRNSAYKKELCYVQLFQEGGATCKRHVALCDHNHLETQRELELLKKDWEEGAPEKLLEYRLSRTDDGYRIVWANQIALWLKKHGYKSMKPSEIGSELGRIQICLFPKNKEQKKRAAQFSRKLGC